MHIYAFNQCNKDTASLVEGLPKLKSTVTDVSNSPLGETNGHMSETKASLHVGDGWSPHHQITRETLVMSEYFHGFQFRYIEGDIQVFICVATL